MPSVTTTPIDDDDTDDSIPLFIFYLLPAFVGEVASDEDEGYWKYLAHVEEHALFKAFLYFLGVFYEETEGENQEDV